MRKLTLRELPAVRLALLKRQENVCPLCLGKIKLPALDHCHTRGHIRAVLCLNCNGIEGKINNLVKRAARGDETHAYLSRLSAYLKLHQLAQYALIHPTFRTLEEKRVARNLRARKKRAASKS